MERYSDAKQGEKGPSWRDVLLYWKELCETSGHDITLVLQQTTSINGRLGIRGLFGCPCEELPYAAVTYGPAYADSPATFPAAIYKALLAADEFIEQRNPDAGYVQLDLPLDISEGDLPF